MPRIIKESDVLELKKKKEPVGITMQTMANQFVGYLRGLKAEPIEIHSRNGREGVLYTLSVRPKAVPLGNLFTLFTYIEGGKGLITSFLDCDMKNANLAFFLQEREYCGGGFSNLHIDKEGTLNIPNNTVNGHVACILYWCSCAMRLSYTGTPAGFKYFDTLGPSKEREDDDDNNEDPSNICKSNKD